MAVSTKTFNVIFHLRNSIGKDERLPISARITIDGRRIELSVKQMINARGWNEKRGMAKPINEEYKKLNNHLGQLRSIYVKCYRQM